MLKYLYAPLAVLFLFLAPSQPPTAAVPFVAPAVAHAQAFTYTESTPLTIVYTGGAHKLEMQSAWYYDNSAGSYMWNTPGVSFDVTLTAYTSSENFQNGVVHSTSTTNHPCSAGEWSVALYSPGVVRVYGYKQITLPPGFYYSVSVLPKAHGAYRLNFFAQWGGFVWNGQQRGGYFDMIHPGDS